ncbi:hypothetical protein COX84_03095 [Candidatus Micrarchaeota archaeon CG_4_10_14_0_2_um_filter_49_7]|nr:MAG: hypothetical protein COX84_03095 [Candidatus Micrarchaeota archaeon CG_4_10_14_0_2_um_filter_49_7]HII53583.1 prephenate dehydrogenase [Candidatus Micrarchaeota archaeon]
MPLSILIIGAGRMGITYAKAFAGKGLNVAVYAPHERLEKVRGICNSEGLAYAEPEKLPAFDIFFIATSMGAIPDYLKLIDRKAKGKLIVEIGSVKSYLKNLRIRRNDVCLAHPLHGPDDFAGRNCALIPYKIGDRQRYDEFVGLLVSLGLKVFDTTIEEHDLAVAQTQVLPHFLALGFGGLSEGADRRFITPTFEKMSELAARVKGHGPGLTEDIQKLNPYAKAERKKVIGELARLNRELRMKKKAVSIESEV